MSFFARLINEHISIILGAGVSLGVIASMTPEVFYISNYRKMTAFLEKDGEERKIDPDTQDLLNRVLYKLQMRPREEAGLDFYMSALSDPTHYGSTKLRSGAVVGLPASFQYREDTDLSKESFSFAGIRLVYDETSNSEASKRLAKAFLISSKAKAFVMAREIFYASSYRLHVETGLRAAVASGLVLSWGLFYSRVPFAKRLKTWSKMVIFGGMGFAWGMLYFFVRDAHRCWIDYAVDKRTAKLGKPFAEGGVEYYQSVLERNKAIRVLLPNGKSQFTQFGNDVTTLRQKTLQKTTRRDLLVRMLEEYKTEEGEVVPPPTPPSPTVSREEKAGGV